MAETPLKKAMDIVDNLDDQDFNMLIDYIRFKVKARQKERAARAAADVNIGDRVRLINIKPQYMIGQTGVVESKNQTRFTVKLDRGPIKKFRTGTVICSPACLERIG